MNAIDRNYLSNDWVTFTLLFCLALIFLMKLYKPQYLLGYLIAFFTEGFIKKQAENNPLFLTAFKVLGFVFVNAIISLTISIYIDIQSFTRFLIIYGFVAIILLLHTIITAIILKTFEIENLIKYFISVKSGYLYTVCLWTFPVLIFYYYGFANLYFFSSIITILLLFRAFLIIRNNKKLIFNNLFYFILYLCTLEIAPLLIAYKIIIT